LPPLNLYARVRFFVHVCTRDRGCSAHPAFPAPSFSLRVAIDAKLGRIAPRERGRTPSRCLTIESVCPQPRHGRFFSDGISCPGRGAAFSRRCEASSGHAAPLSRDPYLRSLCLGPGSAEHHAATRRIAPRPGHELTRASARRLRQRAENPRPRANALVETLQVVFFVRRMDVVVVEPKTHQHGVETERALEIRDDRDRGA
jgi:hypothetical protein